MFPIQEAFQLARAESWRNSKLCCLCDPTGMPVTFYKRLQPESLCRRASTWMRSCHLPRRPTTTCTPTRNSAITLDTTQTSTRHASVIFAVFGGMVSVFEGSWVAPVHLRPSILPQTPKPNGAAYIIANYLQAWTGLEIGIVGDSPAPKHIRMKT